MDLYIASVGIFVAILAVLLYRSRDRIEVQNRVLFIRRTERGRGLISRISSLSRAFWSKLGIISIIVGFGGMLFGFYYIADIFVKQIFGAPVPGGGPKLVLPVPSQDAAFLPGVLGVPFWPWMISIGLLMVVHEGMHGVMVKTVRSKIKSLGVLLLVVIPGAFVEPDEEDLKKKNWVDQLKVYSAGSFGNFCLAGVVFLITTFLFLPAFTVPVVGFQGYLNASEYGVDMFPAQAVNLTKNITHIDGHRVRTVEELTIELDKKSPGDRITVRTLKGNYTLELASDPNNRTEAFLGIGNVQRTQVLKEKYRNSSTAPVLNFLKNLMGWIFLLNLGIGIMNLLPLKPLDGGLMVESVARNFYPDRSDRIVRAFSSATLFILIGVFLLIFL